MKFLDTENTTNPPLLSSSIEAFIDMQQWLFECTPAAIAVVDTEQRIIYCNKALAELLVRDDKPVIGQYIKKVFPRLRGLKNSIDSCMETSSRKHLCRTMTDLHSGIIMPLNISIHALATKDNGKRAGAIIQIERDFSSLMEHLQDDNNSINARISEITKDNARKTHLIRTLFDNSPIGMAIVDQNRKILQMNKAGREILGTDRSIGVSCSRFFNCEHDGMTCPLTNKSQSQHHVEATVFNDTGKQKTLLHSAIVSKEQGEDIVLETFVDISALREAQAATESALKAKNAFIANMNHELRTPLNAIIGCGELLKLTIEEELDIDQETKEEQLLTPLRHINNAGKTLVDIINQVLDLSKMESSEIDLNIKKTSITQLVAEVESVIKPLAEKNNNHFSSSLSVDTDTINIDPVRLKQILINLLGNSCKFTEQGNISLDLSETDNKQIHIVIHDTGIGIEEDKLEKIFLPFEQSDSSTTRRYGGTGLGLPIAKQLCEKMGGEIMVESQPNRGSYFTINLPI